MSKILIVEDDLAMQQIFVEVLKIDGHSTICASDGRRAVQALSNQHPDILVLDMNLPELSGYELLQYIDESGMYQEMKIVIVTANNGIVDSAEAKRVDAVLLKPISMPQFRSTVGQLVGLQSA